jgi:hypothetical protein
MGECQVLDLRADLSSPLGVGGRHGDVHAIDGVGSGVSSPVNLDVNGVP